MLDENCEAKYMSVSAGSETTISGRNLDGFRKGVLAMIMLVLGGCSGSLVHRAKDCNETAEVSRAKKFDLAKMINSISVIEYGMRIEYKNSAEVVKVFTSFFDTLRNYLKDLSEQGKLVNEVDDKFMERLLIINRRLKNILVGLKGEADRLLRLSEFDLIAGAELRKLFQISAAEIDRIASQIKCFLVLKEAFQE